MTIAIHAKDLSKSYRHNDAVSGFALVGANGAGKTTIIKILVNIFGPTSGHAQLLGVDSTLITGSVFNRIGYVSENQEMPDWMTVESLLEYLRPFYPDWDRALEQQLVRQFDLPLKRKLKHLSRGMRMKAALASILAYRPSLIILDEPFTGLDPLVRDELIESLLERAAETTIFLSSHDLGEIESFASHVGYIERGRMLFSDEMSTLTGRFREVEVTLTEPAPLPPGLPSSWLQPESSGTVVHFIESNFSPGHSPGQIADLFPEARNISTNAMPLRAIFLAVAKAGRRSLSSGNQETEA
jgi:ABC-2 type transport system ATP-binding protein